MNDYNIWPLLDWLKKKEKEEIFRSQICILPQAMLGSHQVIEICWSDEAKILLLG